MFLTCRVQLVWTEASPPPVPHLNSHALSNTDPRLQDTREKRSELARVDWLQHSLKVTGYACDDSSVWAAEVQQAPKPVDEATPLIPLARHCTAMQQQQGHQHPRHHPLTS